MSFSRAIFVEERKEKDLRAQRHQGSPRHVRAVAGLFELGREHGHAEVNTRRRLDIVVVVVLVDVQGQAAWDIGKAKGSEDGQDAKRRVDMIVYLRARCYEWGCSTC